MELAHKYIAIKTRHTRWESPNQDRIRIEGIVQEVFERYAAGKMADEYGKSIIADRLIHAMLEANLAYKYRINLSVDMRGRLEVEIEECNDIKFHVECVEWN